MVQNKYKRGYDVRNPFYIYIPRRDLGMPWLYWHILQCEKKQVQGRNWCGDKASLNFTR